MDKQEKNLEERLEKLLRNVVMVGGCGTNKTHGANTSCGKKDAIDFGA